MEEKRDNRYSLHNVSNGSLADKCRVGSPESVQSHSSRSSSPYRVFQPKTVLGISNSPPAIEHEFTLEEQAEDLSSPEVIYNTFHMSSPPRVNSGNQIYGSAASFDAPFCVRSCDVENWPGHAIIEFLLSDALPAKETLSINVEQQRQDEVFEILEEDECYRSPRLQRQGSSSESVPKDTDHAQVSAVVEFQEEKGHPMTKPIGRHLVKGAKPTSEREKEKSPPARARARTLPTAPKGLTKNFKPTSNLQMKLLSVAPQARKVLSQRPPTPRAEASVAQESPEAPQVTIATSDVHVQTDSEAEKCTDSIQLQTDELDRLDRSVQVFLAQPDQQVGKAKQIATQPIMDPYRSLASKVLKGTYERSKHRASLSESWTMTDLDIDALVLSHKAQLVRIEQDYQAKLKQLSEPAPLEEQTETKGQLIALVTTLRAQYLSSTKQVKQLSEQLTLYKSQVDKLTKQLKSKDVQLSRLKESQHDRPQTPLERLENQLASQAVSGHVSAVKDAEEQELERQLMDDELSLAAIVSPNSLSKATISRSRSKSPDIGSILRGTYWGTYTYRNTCQEAVTEEPNRPQLANAGQMWANTLRSTSVTPPKERKSDTSVHRCSRMDLESKSPVFKTTKVVSPQQDRSGYSYSKVYTNRARRARKLKQDKSTVSATSDKVEKNIQSAIVTNLREKSKFLFNKSKNEG